MGSKSATNEARPIDATNGSGAHQAGFSEQRTQTGVAQRETSAASSAPLARQNASLGSLDFLKLLESGSHGDSLNFGDVLAANPDWADQHADQSMEAAAAAGGAQRLDADRNPGGGAEPAYDGIPHTLRQQLSDRSLLDEALKLTAPLPTLSEEGEQLLGSLPSMGRLFTSGLSGNFSELVKHPSFSSQIAKNPSFSSAVFSSLLSQKSEDQAMLLQMLGFNDQPALSAPQPALPFQPPGSQAQLATDSTSAPMLSLPQQNPYRQQQQQGKDVLALSSSQAAVLPQLPRDISEASLAEHMARSRAPAPSLSSPWQGTQSTVERLPIEALPIELPRFSEELEGVQQVAGIRQPLPPRLSVPSFSSAELGPMQIPTPMQVSPPLFPGGSSPASVLDSRVILLSGPAGPLSLPLPSSSGPGWQAADRNAPDAPLVNGMATGRYSLPAASAPQQRKANAGALIDQRVGSLDYLLNASPAPSPGTSQAQAPALQLPPLNGHPGSRPATPTPKAYRPAVGDRRGSAKNATITSGVTFQRLPETHLPRSQGFGIALAQPSRPNPHLLRQGAQQLPFAYPSTLIQTPQQRAAAGLPPLAVSVAPQEQKDSRSTTVALTANLRAHSVPGHHQRGNAVPADRRASSFPAPGLPGTQRASSAPVPKRLLQPPSSAGGQTGRPPPNGPATAQAAASGLATSAAAAAHDPSKSKFLSGLMTGISPILTQAGAPATAGSLVSPAAVALQLPKPYVKPLPPLPQVPSIAEYYRKSAAPRILPVSVPQTLPRLEVLPLVPGTVPQAPQFPVNFAAALQTPASSQPAAQAVAPKPANGSIKQPAVTVSNPAPTVQVTTQLTGPAIGVAAKPAAPQQNLPVTRVVPQSRIGLPNGNKPKLVTLTVSQAASKANSRPAATAAPAPHTGKAKPDDTSQGSLEARNSKRGRENGSQPAPAAAKKQAVSSPSLDGKNSEDAQDEDASDGDCNGLRGQSEVQDRKALRKAKNRASAAASRARREAYTASLEEEVNRLQKEQEWLRSQLQKHDSDASAETISPVPLRRQLSL